MPIQRPPRDGPHDADQEAPESPLKAHEDGRAAPALALSHRVGRMSSAPSSHGRRVLHSMFFTHGLHFQDVPGPGLALPSAPAGPAEGTLSPFWATPQTPACPLRQLDARGLQALP